jgi:hypothetical protein
MMTISNVCLLNKIMTENWDWKKNLVWLLAAITIFLSSLSTYSKNEVLYGIEVPNLIEPLETLRANGRLLSAGCLILLLFFNIIVNGSVKEPKLKKQMNFFLKDPLISLLVVVHALFIIKFLNDSPTYLLFASLLPQIFFFVLILTIYNLGRDLKTQKDFIIIVEYISLSAIIFILSNVVQFLIDQNAIFYAANLFVGTTGNPQHAAIFICMTLPSLLFSLEQGWIDKNKIKTFVCLLTICFSLYFLFRTGSRTGLICFAATSIFLISRTNLVASVTFLSFGTFIFASWGDMITKDSSDAISKLSNTSADSREFVWKLALDNFNQYLFGIPFDDELIFVESTWLSLLSRLGLLGFLISLPLVVNFFTKMKMLMSVDKIRREQKRQVTLITANFISAFVISFGEASLLGILTPYVIILMINVILFNFVIFGEKDTFDTN